MCLPRHLPSLALAPFALGTPALAQRTHERVGIQPQEAKGDAPFRWNWDAPFMISPHAPQRLYMAAQFLFRSNNRGNSWKKVWGPRAGRRPIHS